MPTPQRRRHRSGTSPRRGPSRSGSAPIDFQWLVDVGGIILAWWSCSFDQRSRTRASSVPVIALLLAAAGACLWLVHRLAVWRRDRRRPLGCGAPPLRRSCSSGSGDAGHGPRGAASGLHAQDHMGTLGVNADRDTRLSNVLHVLEARLLLTGRHQRDRRTAGRSHLWRWWSPACAGKTVHLTGDRWHRIGASPTPNDSMGPGPQPPR